MIPVGIAAQVPWHAATRVNDDGTSSPWIERRVVSYAPSARSLAGDGSVVRPGRVLAIGAAAADLHWADAEADFAAESEGSMRVADVNGTREHVLATIADYSTVHIACHGVLDLVDPLRSALQLSAGQQILVRDLLAVDSVQGKTFILSACDSTFASVQAATEGANFPAVLLAGGARGAIGTLWPVSDYSSMLLMTDFHRRWRDDQTPAQALRDAQLDMCRGRSGGRRAAHPYYWAGFVCYGT